MKKIDLSNFRVADSATARDINRRIILNLVRKHQPISRAELARRSGLQRSTVSSIIDELIGEKWITEGAYGQVPRGRKPTLLYLNVDRVGAIGVNIQPNKTNIGLGTLDTHFIVLESFNTVNDPEKFIPIVTNRVVEIIKSHPEISYEGIGISVPGRIDVRTGKLVFAPNLGWKNVDLKTPLEKATGLPVELENAANACALAELWSGQHPEEVRNLIAVTVSEGIGVGMVLNGQLVRGTTGMSGEFGHFTMLEDGPLCNCGNRGCWETLASNSACVRFYTQTRPTVPTAKLPTTPTFEDILRLAQQGDPKANHAIEKMAHYLGLGISMLVVGFAPDLLVIVGTITRAWSKVEPIIQNMVAKHCRTGAKTRIVATDPATNPRLRGTIAMVLQKHFSAPQIV
ncbi:MAG: ROK family transcriptional regulator [Verrucomicrobiae bacterium]|nr:ROK family transcriptional regulator [Verrucomicrobiae bacterium]MDW7980621.1 ROK family transcriptional regulator [Verrucomicrobiales bacterium]